MSTGEAFTQVMTDVGLQADLRVGRPKTSASWFIILRLEEHNIRLRDIAEKRGFAS